MYFFFDYNYIFYAFIKRKNHLNNNTLQIFKENLQFLLANLLITLLKT